MAFSKVALAMLLRSPFLVAPLCSFCRVVKFLPVSPISGLAVGAFDLIRFVFCSSLTLVSKRRKVNMGLYATRML